MSKIKKIVLSAMLLATLILLARFFSIKTPVVVFSFAFIPLMFSAILLGPKWTIIISVLGDVIGSLLFPMGAFFIGFTISAAIRGFIYGIFLYKYGKRKIGDKEFLFRVVVSSVIVLLVVNLLLNSLWLNITLGKAWLPLVSTRLVRELIMVPIQVLAICGLELVLRDSVNKYLR